MLSWTEEQHIQDTQQEGSALLLGGEGGNILIYPPFISLQPLARVSAPARDSPELPESPAGWELEKLGKLGSRMASPTAALGSVALAVALPWLQDI